MIIIKLSGGLGNQMFQYAASRSFSLKLGTELKMDISRFSLEGVTKRSYALGVFTLPQIFASPKEISRLIIQQAGPWKNFPRVLRMLELLAGKHHVYENSESIGDNSYLEGDFASEHFFSSNASQIRKDFTFKKELDSRNLKLQREIQHNHSIALHVRRADYVNSPKIAKIFSLCDPDYYFRAMEIFASKISQPHYYVFSDDIMWCRQNLKTTQKMTFVAHNQGLNSYKDLQLMANCQHNIIANSTFSWWSAWLNPNPQKIVVAPKNWVTDRSGKSKNIIPRSWLKL